MRFLLVASAGLFWAQASYAFARLTPEAAHAFDQYVGQAEARIHGDLGPGRFLRVESRPELKTKLRAGELIVERGRSQGASAVQKVPGAMIQDWVGMMFIPGATIEQVKAGLQDYENYTSFYKPQVIACKELDHGGDEYQVFMRVYEKHILTVVLNTTYRVRYAMLDKSRMTVTSRSTKIAEVKDPNKSYTEEEPVGDNTGFLWRLNSYWHFEAADGGVYAECEAISLSRDIPLGLGWMIKGFLEGFPKESMANTLRGTRAAVEAHPVSWPSAAR